MEDLTEAECGSGGYEKIIQFLYVYYLIEDRVGRGNPTRFDIWEDIVSSIFAQKIPKKFEKSVHRPYLEGMLQKLNAAYTESKSSFKEIKIMNIPTREPSRVFEIIKVLIKKGI